MNVHCREMTVGSVITPAKWGHFSLAAYDLVLPSVGRPSNNAVANVAEMVPAVYDSLGSLAANDVVAADDGIDARARDKCPTASLVGTTLHKAKRERGLQKEVQDKAGKKENTHTIASEADLEQGKSVRVLVCSVLGRRAYRRVLGRVGAIRDPNRHRSIGGLEAVRLRRDASKVRTLFPIQHS